MNIIWMLVMLLQGYVLEVNTCLPVLRTAEALDAW